MFHSLSRWIAKKFSPARKSRKPRRRMRARLEVEQLETRVAPAVIATVDTLNDTNAVTPASSPLDASGNISLRSAVEYANANNFTGTIGFKTGLSGTITYTTSSITISSNVTIDGSGASITVNGSSDNQDFNFGAGSLFVTIENLTLTNTNSSGNAAGKAISTNTGTNLTLVNDTIFNCSSTSGGAVYNAGTLVVTGCTFENNGAGQHGGAISNNGTLTLTNSTLSDNTSGHSGGGIFNESSAVATLSGDTISGNSSSQWGGGIYNNGSLTLTSVTIDNNTATNSGGGIYNGAGNLAVTDCTVGGNTALLSGGGVYLIDTGGNLTFSNDTWSSNTASKLGGAIYLDTRGNCNFTNSTIAGNTAATGGGMYLNGVPTLSEDTVSANTATNAIGGGVDNVGASATVNNTIVAGNTGGDFSGSSIGSNNLIGGNPLLGALQNNGGPTQTMAELPGSLAIGNGIALGISATDQRGFQRLGSAPLLSGSNTGGNLNAGNYYFVTSYTTAAGNTIFSRESHTSVLTNGMVKVASPTAPSGTVDYNVYVGTSSGTETFQGTALIGSSYTQINNPSPGSPPTGIDIGAFQNQAQWFSQSGPSAQTATAASAASLKLGSFSYSGSSGNLWTVDVNWGDNTADSVFSTSSQGTLPAQSHTYSSVGKYTVTITVKDGYNDFSQATGTVTVGGSVLVNTLSNAHAQK